MKIILSIICALFWVPIGAFSQSLSAYGVTLGDDKYEVESILENKGKRVRYDTNNIGEDLLKISNPTIGGAKFESGTFIFNKKGKLRSIYFFSTEIGGTGTPGMPWEAQFHRKAEEYKKTFLTMTQNLKQKYGVPDTYTNTSAIWQIGNERITLNFKYKYEYDSMGWIDHHAGVNLEYEFIDINNVDY